MSTSSSECLWDRWARWAEQRPDADAIVHMVAGEATQRWTWKSLVHAALGFATVLKAAGVQPGQVCALVIRHHPQFYPLYLGISALGAIPSVLAYPNARIHPDKFVHGLAGMARRSGLDWIATERSLEPVVRPLVESKDTSVRGLLFPLDGVSTSGAATRPFQPDPSAPCLLQHSSGTTGLQKAVVLSHRSVLEHVHAYATALDLKTSDKIASWLPLYHDMGMIAAFHLPLAFGIPLIQLDPFEWVTAPMLLLDAISREGATLTWLPNFAYNLLADRVHEEELEGIRLDTMRLFVNCSEPVRAESHRKFLERYQPRGVRPDSLAACYAMAETTFAATQTPLGAQARTVFLDRDALSRGQVALVPEGDNARACVSSGHPIPGCEIRVEGEADETLPDGSVGELLIRSATMFDGYRNYPDETARVLRDGWYHSGDYGFALDGEYYVIGRKKDIIIVAGKNLYPEDIEDEVGRVPGIIPGRVIAFGLEDETAGTEQVCIVAESEATAVADQRNLRLDVQRAAMAIDVTVAKVYLAPPRWLIKSSAGKPSRKANRQRIFDGELAPV